MKIAIITDIHEDVESLRTAFSKIEKTDCDEIICLGDISGFSVPHFNYYETRNAHECLALIKANCKIVIRGNHDMHAGKIVPENCSFFNFPDNWYQLDYHDRRRLGGSTLWLHEENDLDPLYKADDLAYLKSLQDYSIMKISGLIVLFSHYIYPNISGLEKKFYTCQDEIKPHFQFMNSLECSISFIGHSHINGIFTATEEEFNQYGFKKLILKPGPVCVGLPPISRNKKGNGFCVFDTHDMSISAIRI